MKAADLAKAQNLVARLDIARATLARLEAGEVLTLTLGTGGNACGIALSASYLARLRGDLIGDLRRLDDQLDGELRGLGVEAD